MWHLRPGRARLAGAAQLWECRPAGEWQRRPDCVHVCRQYHKLKRILYQLTRECTQRHVQHCSSFMRPHVTFTCEARLQPQPSGIRSTHFAPAKCRTVGPQLHVRGSPRMLAPHSSPYTVKSMQPHDATSCTAC